MPLYEFKADAGNRISVSAAVRGSVVVGTDAVLDHITGLLADAHGRPVRVAFDGYYGIDWPGLVAALRRRAAGHGIEQFEFVPMHEAFKPRSEIDAYTHRFTETSDPGFGVVNTDGQLSDLLDGDQLARLRARLMAAAGPVIVYGPGAAVAGLADCYELRLYFDKTRQPLLWQMWDGRFVPLGSAEPDPGYGWKQYYYCDCYLLDRHKQLVLERIDYWVDSVSEADLKLLPKTSYDTLISTLVSYPIKQVPIFSPGPWGGYRFKDLWDVPGLENNAWNEIISPELSVLAELDGEVVLNLPLSNLMRHSQALLGEYLATTYPDLFPLNCWLEEAYFPTPTPPERTSMPIHNHPSSDYVDRHFKEPLGRYETYYIAEAYEGARTWLGYTEDADLEEWERLCRDSGNVTEIPNWQDFIKGWDSAVGDLFLIPAGTTHASGGNQLILEMDTCPSVASTEYSFFLYDFARNSWDDQAKEMAGKPMKMHLDHGFSNDKWVRESWAEDHLLAKPKVIKWTRDYTLERYSSDPRMPTEIERLQFTEHAEHDTQGRYAHIVTLTAGDEVEVRSTTDSSRHNTIKRLQAVIVPASFGAYQLINNNQGPCTVVLLRWKRG